MHGTYDIQTLIACCWLVVKHCKLGTRCFVDVFIHTRAYMFVNATYMCAYYIYIYIYVTRRNIAIFEVLESP